MRPPAPHHVLTSVKVFFRHAHPQLQALEHVVQTVHAFLDLSVRFSSVSSAVKFGSVDLLRRVAFHEEVRWRVARDGGVSTLHIECYKMRQCEDAMEIVAANPTISVDIAQWFLDEYSPKRSSVRSEVFKIAAREGHAALLTWLTKRLSSWKRLDWQLMRTVAERGHVGVLQWWIRYNDSRAFSALELDVAAGDGNLDTVKLMYKYSSDLEKPCTIRAMDAAGRNGHLHIVKWLHEYCGLRCTSQAMRGSLEVAKYLYKHQPKEAVVDAALIQSAAQSGDIEFIEWVLAHTKGKFENAHLHSTTEQIAMNGDWEMLQWLHAHSRNIGSHLVFRGAVLAGNVGMIRWLYAKYPNAWRSARILSLDAIAAGAGNLDILQWLHLRLYPFSTNAMNLAAKYGYLTVVQWLHEHRREGATTEAMDEAARNGHLEVVKFLHFNRSEGCTAAAMSEAASQGHLDIVQFLHEHRSEGCTGAAMDRAAMFGHIGIVKFLHYNRNEGCSTFAMDNAPSVEILAFLHENRSEGCTSKVYLGATARGDLEMLDWLREHKPALMDLEELREVATSLERYSVVLWTNSIQMEQSQLGQDQATQVTHAN